MSADVVTIAPKDLYHARMVAPHVDATIPVHAPTGRVVYQVVSPSVMRLGPPVSAFRERGYTVTPWAREAGR